MEFKINHIKRVLILGASTRTGKILVKKALTVGLQVNILLSADEEFDIPSKEQLQIFIGDSTCYQDLEAALKGCHAVISALRIKLATVSPWSRLITRPDLLSATMVRLISLCSRLYINHIVIVSAWGAGDSRKHIPAWYRWLIDHSNIKYAYQNHELQEELLRKSGVDFTIIRPAAFTNFISSKSVLISINGHPKPSMIVNRLGVANFAISALNKRYNCQTLMVSSF
jgi:putative NADH-flavin reductase